MNESLNRAFIRAYDKEKSSENRRKIEAEKQQADELSQLMVQFDTASVQIPAPHMLKAQLRREAAASSAPASSTAASRPQRSMGADIPTPEAPVAEAPVAKPTSTTSELDIRGSIAEQMLRATNWEAEAFGAFAPDVRFSQRSPLVEYRPGVVSSQGSEVTLKPPHANLEDLATPASSPQFQASSSSPQPLATEVNPAIPATAEGLPSGASPQVPDLTPPVAPALTAASFETAEGQASNRQETSGSIFRLDRPSYDRKETDAQPRREQVADLTASRSADLAEEEGEDELSDVSETLLLDRAQIDGQPRDPSSQEKPQTQPVVSYFPKNGRNLQLDAEALKLEKELRAAKLRIFNPVWEVDSLQWPPICVELMHRMSPHFKTMAENLSVACQEGLQVMAVTSPQRGEGTTTVACCLAQLAGSHGLNVAIVDGDIEKPTLSYQTNLDVEQDWCGALLHNMSLEEVAVHAIDDQVTVVPLLNPIHEHEMTTSDERIAEMIRVLSASFDLVIVDTGRVDSTRSLLRMLGERGLINAAIAVVDYRSSTPDRVEACLQRIRQAGVNSVGLIENFAA